MTKQKDLKDIFLKWENASYWNMGRSVLLTPLRDPRIIRQIRMYCLATQSIVLSFMLIPYDLWFYGSESETPILFSFTISSQIYPFLIVANYVLGAVLSDLFLDFYVSDAGLYTKKARVIRMLWAGIPILGLSVLPWWLSMTKSKPAWATNSVPKRLDLRLSSYLYSGRMRAMASGNRPLVLLLLIILITHFSWLVLIWGADFYLIKLKPEDMPLLKVVIWAVHLITFVLFIPFAKEFLARRQWGFFRKTVTLIAPFFLLIPGASIVGWILLMSCETNAGSHSEKSLVSRIYNKDLPPVGLFLLESQIFARAIPRWWPQRFRREPRYSKSERYDRHTSKIKKLAQLKVAFLPFEAAIAGVYLGQTHPGPYNALSIILFFLVPLCSLLTLGGLVLGFVGFFKRLRKPEYWRHMPIHEGAAPFFVHGQFAMVAGIVLGFLRARGDHEDFIPAVFAFSAVALAFFIPRNLIYLFAPVPKFMKNDPAKFWPLIYIAMIATTLKYPDSPIILEYSIYFYPWLPVASIILGYFYGEWLIKPHTWRKLIKDRLPLRMRLELFLTGLTAVIPLGGLFAPWWIKRHNQKNGPMTPASEPAAKM